MLRCNKDSTFLMILTKIIINSILLSTIIKNMKPSKSPDRFSFQKNSYIKRCSIKNKNPTQANLDLFDKMRQDDITKFDDLDCRKDNLEWELLTTAWILEKVRASEVYAQNLYAALCNNEFQKREVWPILKDARWYCSWRHAGGIIADMRQEGDYINWYCSGIRHDGNSSNIEFVGEGYVTEEIRTDLFELGWIIIMDTTNEQT